VFNTVEVVGMEEKIVEFSASEPPSEVSTRCRVYGG
jgi:hypothetical protein